ncbi:hypothetical protein AKJ39_04015 [candidate division MSBL1 archaeon SCGC-AAA259J03]|uniref:UspA domain-containing protein n=1 Tax=candidate division MSBL1 archaeon SCGC-AAA259J03 TaxID=1698269 RepID=A0A656YVD7_9EURY|nr:hypothetical protein AKJ39_04015 [candidate division MSBL1 archaeon SCGC-AAA259J03]
MIEKIIVPIDSIEWDNTFMGVETAIEFAKGCRVNGQPELIFIHVLTSSPTTQLAEGENTVNLEKHRLKDEFYMIEEMCKKRGINKYKTLITEGDPKKEKGIDEEIIETAEKENADLIVMGSGKLHDRSFRGRIGKFVYGSVTEKVIHEAPCSVLVARPAELVDKILVPVDSLKWDSTMNAVKRGMELSQGCSTEKEPELVFLHVLHSKPKVPMAERERLMEMKKKTIDEEFKEIEKMCEERSIKNYETVLSEGNPEKEIIKNAKEKDIDVIVMGSGKLHDRTPQGRIHKFFYGSVTETVLHSAPCSILVTR